MAIFRILDFYRLSDLECPDFVGTAAYHHVSWLCLQQVGNVLSFAGRNRGLGELWNTLMVGVFVAFIRVVYGRMIYMSLPLLRSLVVWIPCTCY